MTNRINVTEYVEDEFKKTEELKTRFINLIGNTKLTRMAYLAYLEAEVEIVKEDIELDKDLDKI